ncbi:unnamed protein product [Brassica rapa subsp. trilocularis]
MALEPNFLLSWIFLCIAATISSTLFFFRKKQHKFRSKKLQQPKKKLPPGEMGLPWIGETMEFYKAQKNNRVFEDFVNPRIIKHGNLFKTKIMGSPTIVVNGAEANRLILSNEFSLVVSSWPSSSVQLMGMNCIMAKQGEKHRVLRGIVANSLSYNGLESLLPNLCDTVRSHLDTQWRGKEEISLYRSTKALTFTVVFECLYGIKVELGMLEIFERVLEGVFALPVEFPCSRFARAKKARVEIETLLVEKVREKRREMEQEEGGERPNTTLFSRLVQGLIKGEITEEEVVDNMVLLVFAAHDTTSYAMAMTFKMLAQHPTCLHTLLKEHVQIKANKGEGEYLTVEDVKKMKYSWQVVRETMRLSPPIFGSFRKAVVDINYGGFTIPKGWKVLWTTYGTHYNPEIFEDPMSFNPSRFDKAVQAYTYLPFGGGPRLCAGHQLAKVSILVFLHFVVTSYDWSLVYPDETISMDPLPLPSLGMPIKISPKVNRTKKERERELKHTRREMEKVGEDEKTIGEASNSTEETRNVKEDERITEEGSTDPSNSQTANFEDHDVSEYEMEDEEVLELFRRSSSLRPKVAKTNNFPYPNKSEEMVLQFPEDTPAETEQTNVEFHSMTDTSEIAGPGAEDLDISVILEGVRSSSDSKEDSVDSSSDSDLSSYYFDGSLPVSAHVEEPETHQDESHLPKDENQMPLLRLNQPVQQLTSWRSCCGLLELLRADDP